MEATIVHRGYIGTMENTMETTIVYKDVMTTKGLLLAGVDVGSSARGLGFGQARKVQRPNFGELEVGSSSNS